MKIKSNPYKQACFAQNRLSKTSLLAAMPSQLDKTKAIVFETGEVLSLSNYSEDEIKTNINNKTWVYFEENSPRKMFLLNPNWVINSFDPITRNICVTFTTPSGTRVVNIDAKNLAAQH